MKEYTEEALLKFLDGIDVREPIHPDEITVDDFCERRHLDRTKGRHILKGEVDAGTMTRRPATKDGSPCFAYSLVKK